MKTTIVTTTIIIAALSFATSCKRGFSGADVIKEISVYSDCLKDCDMMAVTAQRQLITCLATCDSTYNAKMRFCDLLPVLGNTGTAHPRAECKHQAEILLSNSKAQCEARYETEMKNVAACKNACLTASHTKFQ